MSNTLIRVYDHLANAERARHALVASGFSSECVHLAAADDEAGPAQGNSILEYKDAAQDSDKSSLDSALNRDDVNEGLARQDVAWRGNYLLTVDVQNDEQLARAADITQQFGAIGANRHTPS